jgi:hypothetical protein
MELGSQWTDFHEILHFSIFRKSVEKIQVSLKWKKNRGYFIREDQYTLFITSRSIPLRMRNVSDKSCRENQNTHFVFSNFFFLIVPSCDNAEKYCRGGETLGAELAHCMLDA